MPGKKSKQKGRKKHQPGPSPATPTKASPESSREAQAGPKDEAPHLPHQISTTSATTSSPLSSIPEPEQESQPLSGAAAEETEGTSRGGNLVHTTHGSPSSSHIIDNRIQGTGTGTGTPGSENLTGITSLAQRTRSHRPALQLAKSDDWEAPTIAARKAREETQQPVSGQVLDSDAQAASAASSTTGQRTDAQAAETSGKLHKAQDVKSTSTRSMSRNRQRGPTARDNGEEISIWNKLIQDITKAKEVNEKQGELGEKVYALDLSIREAGNKPTLAEINQLEDWQKQIKKLADQEYKLLNEPPADIRKNMELLTALRSHSESNAAQGKHRKRKPDTTDGAADSPGPSAAPVAEKIGRLKSASHRSASVSSAQARDGEASEGTKGMAAEKSGRLSVGAEVVFKHNKKQHGMEGEGIQCIIKSITGEGNKKRYEVQDPEPIENGEEGAVYKTSAASLIPIPQVGANLPSFSAGKQVLARYPDTTTFYRAEVVGSKKEVYRLRFEGEEDDKEMEVDRRFVLDIPGK